MKKNEFLPINKRKQQLWGITTVALLMVTSVIAVNAILNSRNFSLRPQAVLYPEGSGQGEIPPVIPPIQEGQGEYKAPDNQIQLVEDRVTPPSTHQSSSSVTVIYDPASRSRIEPSEFPSKGIIRECSTLSGLRPEDPPCLFTYELGQGEYTPPHENTDSDSYQERAKLFSTEETDETDNSAKKTVEVKVSDNASVVIDDPKDQLKSKVFDSAVLAEKLVAISNPGQKSKDTLTLVASNDKLLEKETKITADISGLTTIEVPPKELTTNSSLDNQVKKEITQKLFGIKLLTASEEQENKFKSGYCPLGKSECSSLEAYIGVVEQQEGQVDDNGMMVLKDGTRKSVYTDFSSTASKFLDSTKDLTASQHTVMTEISGFVPSNYSENKLSVIYLNKDQSTIAGAYLCAPEQQCLGLSECQSKGKSSSSYCYQGQTQGAVCCQQ